MSPTRAPSVKLLQFGFSADRGLVQPEQSMREFVRRHEVALHILAAGRSRRFRAAGGRRVQ